jgi:DNA repair protein RadC
VLTDRLRRAGDLIGITILDHLILGDDRTFSFADQGWPE